MPRGPKSHHWDPTEDELLRRLVRENGARNWPFIAEHMPSREAKQCRERWLYHLNPEIKKGRLSEEEWNAVVRLQRELGNRWSAIAQMIPGRSPNQIKNHWHSFTRRRANRNKNARKPAKKQAVARPQSRAIPPSLTIVVPAASNSFSGVKRGRDEVQDDTVLTTPTYNLRQKKRPRYATYSSAAAAYTSEENSSHDEDAHTHVVARTPTAHLAPSTPVFADTHPFAQSGLELLCLAMYSLEEPEVFAAIDHKNSALRTRSVNVPVTAAIAAYH